MSDDLIVKHNKLINAKYTLTRTQAKFIAYMASKIDKDVVDFFEVPMRLNEVLTVLDVERSNWKQLGKTLKQLQVKQIALQDDDNVMEYVSLISYFKIDNVKNEVKCRFDDAMKLFLLNLKDNFTKLSLEKIFMFDSTFTIRLYEIVQQQMALYNKYKNRNLLTLEYDLQELKELLVGDYDIKEDKVVIKKSYQRYSNFKQMVLEVARKELKEKGEYYFEYEEIKNGRSVAIIKLNILTNSDKIKEDFKEKKKIMFMSGKEKQLAQEQIKRIIDNKIRKGDVFKDRLKYEQKLFNLYLRGELKYDKDLQAIKDELDREEMKKMFREYDKEKRIAKLKESAKD